LSKEYTEENVALVEKGCANLISHIENVRKHGVHAVVAINRFAGDTDAELAAIKRIAKENGARDAVVAEHFSKGGAGAVDLGKAVMAACQAPSDFKLLYDAKKDPIKTKIETIVREVYGGGAVEYSEQAAKTIAVYEKDPAIRSLPVCMSKTQYSLSDDANKLGAPKGFTVNVKDIYVSAGAGFMVVSLGAINFIPGLAVKPAYYKIDLDFSTDPPRIVGLS